MEPFFIYCRKSTEAEDRQVLSLETQIEELRRLATTRGVHVVEVLSEARSAKAPGRIVFNKMMERVYRGEVRGILAWKLDRLARNPIDGGAIIWAMKEHGLTILTPAQTFSYASDNTILMYIEFGMAQKYIEDLAKNVKRGLAAKAERGWYPALAPLGYSNNRHKDQGLRDIDPDPERFSLVRRMWDLMLTGTHSVPQIHRVATEVWGLRTRQARMLGGKPLALSALYAIFTNPFYYGWFEYPRGSGSWYRGRHLPMITEEEYERVQELLGRKGKPRSQKHEFAFTGLIHCGECGRTITAEKKHQLICSHCRLKFASLSRDRCPRCATLIADMHSPVRLLYVYYHCTGRRSTGCGQSVVTAEELERQIAASLNQLDLSGRSAACAHEALEQERGRYAAEVKLARATAERAKAEIEKRIAQLVDLKTSPTNADGSLLSEREYGLRRKDLLSQKEQLERALSTDGAFMLPLLKTEALLEAVCGLQERFVTGTPEEKRRILRAVGSNLQLTDKIFSMQAAMPFRLIADFNEESPAVPEPIEPTENGLTTPSPYVQPSHFLFGCAQKEFVRTLPAAAGTPHRPSKEAKKRAVKRKQSLSKRTQALVFDLLGFFREHPEDDQMAA